MDRKKRCEILRAMDLIARTLNNDPLYTEWMIEAVIDEDMTDQTTDKDLEGYVKNDDEFAGILFYDCSAFSVVQRIYIIS